MTGPGAAPRAVAPAAPPIADSIFGGALPRAQRYAELLATAGIERGLIGPREVPRLWDRHLLNCAVLSTLLPAGARLVDVGSGAGLPGLPVAIARPDVHVDLVESLDRRATFLTEVSTELELTDRVRVVRGRAEDAATIATVGPADWVTARAVAPLDRLVRWCLPMIGPGGQLLAMKGSSVQDEIGEHRATLRSLGVDRVEVVEIGKELPEPTWVAVVRRGAGRGATRPQSSRVKPVGSRDQSRRRARREK